MVKFTSRVTGDLLMLSSDGKRVLLLIGKQPGSIGIILPEQMEEAVRKLLVAAAQEEELARERPRRSLSPDDGEPVPLKQRTLPLVRMLHSCRDEHEPIVWELVERRR